MKEKSDLPGQVDELTKELKAKYNIPIKKIQCDNAGENCALKSLCKKGNDIAFKHAAPGTPQQNGHVDQKFVMLFDQMRSILN